MTLNDYQIDAMNLRLPSSDAEYALYGLVSEVGELFGHLAKARRDGRLFEHDMLIKKELGDVFWMLAAIASDNGYTLDEIAMSNLHKLYTRKEKGTLQGSGDLR